MSEVIIPDVIASDVPETVEATTLAELVQLFEKLACVRRWQRDTISPLYSCSAKLTIFYITCTHLLKKIRLVNIFRAYPSL